MTQRTPQPEVEKGGWLSRNWPFFAVIAWFVFVWRIDDLLGAWLSCVGMLFIALLASWEIGDKMRRDKSREERNS